jgi:hypothetical protein
MHADHTRVPLALALQQEKVSIDTKKKYCIHISWHEPQYGTHEMMRMSTAMEMVCMDMRMIYILACVCVSVMHEI